MIWLNKNCIITVWQKKFKLRHSIVPHLVKRLLDIDKGSWAFLFVFKCLTYDIHKAINLFNYSMLFTKAKLMCKKMLHSADAHSIKNSFFQNFTTYWKMAYWPIRTYTVRWFSMLCICIPHHLGYFPLARKALQSNACIKMIAMSGMPFLGKCLNIVALISS